MGKINIAVFDPNENTADVHDVWQWDYGQILRIQGLNLPSAVEIHFSLLPTGGEAKRRVGVTKDGVTDVTIPDFCLEANMITNYIAYAFAYLSDTESGETVKRIRMHITARPKPEAFESQEAEDLFRQAIEASRESLDGSREAEKSAEAWAHGHPDYPERAEDNAAYYAGQAKDALKEVSGEVKDAKKAIDKYVTEKEAELKGDTGNVYFAAFKVVNGRLMMYSDPEIDKVRFMRVGSRLLYRLNF